MAEAGITSFKIEGRLKNESYVRNVVRDYSMGLDDIVRNGDFVRGSFGQVSGGFIPDTSKTFNRGYTELFLDGKRGKWAAMDAAKSMGEHIGTVSSISRGEVSVRLDKGVILSNGDGFSFVSRQGKVEGFRGDVCSGNTIRCKILPSLFVGAELYRNINTAFEKEIERQTCVREIRAAVTLSFRNGFDSWSGDASAVSEDGREVHTVFEAGSQMAENPERMNGMLSSQISKSAGHYRFSLDEVDAPDGLPFMSASALNGVRRTLAEKLDSTPTAGRPLLNRPLTDAVPIEFPYDRPTYKQNISNRLSESVYHACGATSAEPAFELSHAPGAELMRTRYCIRYELGICPIHQKASRQSLPASLQSVKPDTPLFLLNNGMRLALGFDCRRCEMTVSEE